MIAVRLLVLRRLLGFCKMFALLESILTSGVLRLVVALGFKLCFALFDDFAPIDVLVL